MEYQFSFYIKIKEAELAAKGKSSSENELDDEEGEEGQVWGRKFNISLLDQHTELKKLAEGKYNCKLRNLFIN